MDPLGKVSLRGLNLGGTKIHKFCSPEHVQKNDIYEAQRGTRFGTLPRGLGLEFRVEGKTQRGLMARCSSQDFYIEAMIALPFTTLVLNPCDVHTSPSPELQPRTPYP